MSTELTYTSLFQHYSGQFGRIIDTVFITFIARALEELYCLSVCSWKENLTVDGTVGGENC